MTLCQTGSILQNFNAHTSDVTSCDLASNFCLVTGSSDKTVKVWEWHAGTGYKQKSFSPLRGHKYGITCVRISPQGSMLASTSIDGTAVLWNLHSGSKIHTMVQVSGDPIRICRFCPDSTILVTGGDNGAICIWDLVHRSLIKTIFQHEGTMNALSFTPDSQFLISACSLEVIRVWSTQHLIETAEGHSSISLACVDNAHDLGILSVDVSNKICAEDNDIMTKRYTLASSGNSEDIKIWSISTKISTKQDSTPHRLFVEHTNTFHGHISAVTCVKYNHSGTLLISCSLDKTIKIWDDGGTCLASLNGHRRYVNSITISRDSAIAISGSTGSNDKCVIVWDLYGNLTVDSELRKSHILLGALLNQANSVQEMQMVQHSESDQCKLLEKVDDISEAAINTCCFYNDSLLATGSSDKLIRLFRLQESGSLLEELICSPIDGHSYIVNYVEFSKDGSMLATCSLDGCAYIWNPMTGEKISSIPEIYQALRVVKFSPDNSSLIVAGDDEIATIWDCTTLSKKYILSGHADAITCASFSHDAELIVTTCNNGDFRLWKNDAPIHVQDDAHDLGIQSCDFSENSDPIPNQMLGDNQNYLLATGGNDGFVKLWWISISKKGNSLQFRNLAVKLWRQLRGHGGNVISVKFSPKSSEIICSTGTDRQARIWSVYSGECLHVLDHDSITTCCAFNESCSLLAVGSMDKTLWIWKLPLHLIFQTAVANKIKARKKTIDEWTTSDITKWLNDVGLPEIAEIASKTTLDGHKLITLSEERICSGLDLGDEDSSKLTQQIKWLKRDELQKHVRTSYQEDVPFEFLCPITHEVMLEPVTCSDGFTYERKAVTEWFMSGKYTSPMTNETLTNTDYKSNVELRTKIHQFLYSDDN